MWLVGIVQARDKVVESSVLVNAYTRVFIDAAEKVLANLCGESQRMSPE